MKVAFYKGKGELFNRLTKWWTRGQYSHVELVMRDGVSYSSSYMDGGMRGKCIKYTNSHWDFVEIECDSEPEVMQRIEKCFGMRYDVRGAFGFVLRRVKESRDKMFCSEFVMHALGYDEPWRIDPNACYIILKRIEDECKSRKCKRKNQ